MRELTDMEVISIIIGLLIWLHLFAYGIYSIYTTRKLIAYLYFFKGKELEEEDFEKLIERYTGFFNYIEGYPDRNHYSQLYTNKEFSDFVKRGKKISKYIVIAIPTLLIGLLSVKV